MTDGQTTNALPGLLSEPKIKKTNYKRHLNETHSGKMKSNCPLCYHEFSREKTLEIHLEKVHKPELHFLDEKKTAQFEKEDCKVICKGCDGQFISIISQKYHHMKTHGKGEYQCENCQKRFPSRYNFEKHSDSKICSKKIILPS